MHRSSTAARRFHKNKLDQPTMQWMSQLLRKEHPEAAATLDNVSDPEQLVEVLSDGVILINSCLKWLVVFKFASTDILTGRFICKQKEVGENIRDREEKEKG